MHGIGESIVRLFNRKYLEEVQRRVPSTDFEEVHAEPTKAQAWKKTEELEGKV